MDIIPFLVNQRYYIKSCLFSVCAITNCTLTSHQSHSRLKTMNASCLDLWICTVVKRHPNLVSNPVVRLGCGGVRLGEVLLHLKGLNAYPQVQAA